MGYLAATRSGGKADLLKSVNDFLISSRLSYPRYLAVPPRWGISLLPAAVGKADLLKSVNDFLRFHRDYSRIFYKTPRLYSKAALAPEKGRGPRQWEGPPAVQPWSFIICQNLNPRPVVRVAVLKEMEEMPAERENLRQEKISPASTATPRYE